MEHRTNFSCQTRPKWTQLPWTKEYYFPRVEVEYFTGVFETTRVEAAPGCRDIPQEDDAYRGGETVYDEERRGDSITSDSIREQEKGHNKNALLFLKPFYNLSYDAPSSSHKSVNMKHLP